LARQHPKRRAIDPRWLAVPRAFARNPVHTSAPGTAGQVRARPCRRQLERTSRSVLSWHTSSQRHAEIEPVSEEALKPMKQCPAMMRQASGSSGRRPNWMASIPITNGGNPRSGATCIPLLWVQPAGCRKSIPEFVADAGSTASCARQQQNQPDKNAVAQPQPVGAWTLCPTAMTGRPTRNRAPCWAPWVSSAGVHSRQQGKAENPAEQAQTGLTR